MSRLIDTTADDSVERTPGPWVGYEQGDANHYCLLGPDNKWVIAFLHNGEAMPARQLANIRHIIRASNAHDELVQTLEYCKAWFEKHSPTAPLITGGAAEHPMLTSITAALAKATA